MNDRRFSRRWVWLCLILAAFLPFILRLGLDINAVNRQALRKVYRAWALSPEYLSLKQTHTELRFEKTKESGVFEDLFLSMLQKDFRVVETPESPLVRSYFEKEKNLSGRIEWQAGFGEKFHVFEYEARFTNNALLLGFWIALISIFFAMSVPSGAFLTILVMLLWQVRWNPLGIPGFIWDELKLFSGELSSGIYGLELVIALVTLASFVALLGLRPLLRRAVARWGDRSVVTFMGASLFLEPIFLFVSSKLLVWGPQISWWKVYLGSLCFRFVGVAFLMALVFRGAQSEPEEEEQVDEDSPHAALERSRIEYIKAMTRKTISIEWRGNIWSLLLPLAFILAGGWEWLNAVMIVDAGWSILMLKAFLTGLLLAVLTGSRCISMFIGLLSLAQVAAPTEGHWMAAAVFGFFAEGLWIGWWLSPMKDLHPLLPLNRYRRSFFASGVIGGALGIFVYTAGVPLVLCWIIVLLGMWSFGQIQDGRAAPLAT